MRVGGHRQRKVRTAPVMQRGQDPHDIYSAALSEFADEIGWDRDSLAFHWSQIALARMHCGEPQAIAEFLAMRTLREALDSRGRAPC